MSKREETKKVISDCVRFSVWTSSDRVILDPDADDRDGVMFSLEPDEAREMAKRLFEQTLSKEEARQISKELLRCSNEAKKSNRRHETK